MFRALLLACALAPGTLRVDCPTPADLARGVRLTLGDGEVQVVRTSGDSAVANIERSWPDGQVVAHDYAWGLFLIGTTASSTGEPPVSNNSFVEPTNLPRPGPATNVTIPRVRYLGGGYPPEFREEYRMGPLGSLTLEGCEFRAFEIGRTRTDVMTWEGKPPAVPEPAGEWAYLADLGFAIERWGYSLNGPREIEVLKIEAVP